MAAAIDRQDDAGDVTVVERVAQALVDPPGPGIIAIADLARAFSA